MIDYFWHLENAETTCENLKKVGYKIYKDIKNQMKLPEQKVIKGWFCYTPRYRLYFEPIKKIIEICDTMGIETFDKNKKYLTKHINLLETPNNLKKLNDFSYSIEKLKLIFRIAKKEIKNKIKMLDNQEKNRLNEAMNCFIEDCYYSCIAMSVSAIEFRLFKLMSKENPKKSKELEKKTFGALIQEYSKHKKDYNNIIPEKYNSLFKLCNAYRIFSVHPKREKVTKGSAVSILNLTNIFLFDEKMI